jgi:hypothetical protein
MLLHRARHEAHAKPGILIFVTGDFNRCVRGASLLPLVRSTNASDSSAKGDDEGAYAVLTGAQKPPPVPEEFARRFPLPPRGDSAEPQLVMRDVRVAAPRLHVGGEWATFTGFERRKKDEACIDFVFGRSGGGWCVLDHRFRARGLMAETGRRRTCLFMVIRLTTGCFRATIGLSLRISTFLE